MSDQPLAALKRVLAKEPQLDFAVLIGSQATNQARPGSDWDIAVQWHSSPPVLAQLARQETLRRHLATAIEVDDTQLDLIDLQRANLAMRAAVAEEGIPLKGEDELPWMRFLTRTWRDLEHWYLEQEYAS
ncbi:type VII toxin-antitoxin system MntA family adenylyltransferase antitoxin [Halomonas binhaiensis]|uniref:type VII toxin-antitoxin system MntA family adenylyltransferase antitoxin n=1 Tax=Halomonas binhaiensis TaxID=2562282 RepID=UPI001F073605|nr:nucleotidyltransferase domain-containing protein [Halomonas binhaiensis]